MSDPGITSIVRSLLIADAPLGMPAAERKVILERFLAARKGAVERVSEDDVTPQVKFHTIISYGSEAEQLCEDVFVESR